MNVKCKMENVKLWRRLAAVFVLHFTFYTFHSVSAHAETVKTASQPWVTNRIEQVAAPLRAQIETNRVEIAGLEAGKADVEIISTETIVTTSSYWRVLGANLMPQGENVWYYPRNQYYAASPYTLTYENGVWQLTVSNGTMTQEAGADAEALPFKMNYYSYYANRYWTAETNVVAITNRVVYTDSLASSANAIQSVINNLPAPDFTTNNTTLAETIESTIPGNVYWVTTDGGRTLKAYPRANGSTNTVDGATFQRGNVWLEYDNGRISAFTDEEVSND